MQSTREESSLQLKREGQSKADFLLSYLLPCLYLFFRGHEALMFRMQAIEVEVRQDRALFKVQIQLSSSSVTLNDSPAVHAEDAPIPVQMANMTPVNRLGMEKQYHQEITLIGNRIRELEEASASLPSVLSNEPYPSPTDDPFMIKIPSESPVGEELIPTLNLNTIGPQQTRPESDDINVDIMRGADAIDLRSSEGQKDKKQPTSPSNPSIYQVPQLQRPQLSPLQIPTVEFSPQPGESIQKHSELAAMQWLMSNYPDGTAFLQSTSSSARKDLPISLNSSLYEGFDSDKHNTFKQRSPVTCAPCRQLKVRCNFITDPKACERCLHRGRECIIPSQQSSRALEQERLINQIQSKTEQMKKLIAWIETASQSPEHQPNLGSSTTALQPSSSSNALRSKDPKRTFDGWISKAKGLFLQFEDAIPKSHISKSDANMIPKPPPKVCSRCKALKVECVFFTGSAVCKRCLSGGHDCIVPDRKARSVLSKREFLINDIRTQADHINQLMAKLELVQQLMTKLELVQQPMEKPLDLKLPLPKSEKEKILQAFFQSNLCDSHSAPTRKEINPRIEEWLPGAKQSFLQFEHFIPDLEFIEDGDSDLASWDDDDGFSDIGGDVDAEFQSSHLRKHASQSSNTAITSVSGSIGFPSRKGFGQAEVSALTTLSGKDSGYRRSGADSEEKKEREMGMDQVVQHFDVRRTGVPGATIHHTPALSLSNRDSRLSAMFGQHIVELALINSHLNGARPHCYFSTRENVLKQIGSSLRDNDGRGGLMFLRGAAGVGKTALMQTFAERENEDKRTLATIFYEHEFSGQAGSFDRLIFPILAYQLALQDRPYADDIIETLDRNKSVLGESLQMQFDMLIAGPWARRKSKEPYIQPLLIILDGLDGRGMDKEPYREIIELVSHYTHTGAPKHVSLIVSNPPESLDLPSPPRVMEIEIPIDSDDACEDMEGFLRNEFDAVRKHFLTRTPEEWPPEDDLLRVATAASGYFAFSTSVIDFVGDPNRADPVGQLNAAIAYITGRNLNISPFTTLDTLYSETLHRASPLGLSIAMPLISLFLIPSVRSAKAPPSMVVACNILRLSESVVHYSLSQLSTLLYIPLGDSASTRPLRLLHSSFEDFLLNPARSGTQSIDIVTHKLLIQQCCTAIAQQVNGTPEKAGGLENIQLSWCPRGSDAGEERKKVFVFAAHILASLWEPK